METKGFFSLRIRPMVFILAVIIFEIIMFSPLMYNSHTAAGTSWPFVGVNLVLFMAPTLGLIDGILYARASEKKELQK